MKNNPILKFAKIIAGIYSNKEQALKNPRKFAHIQIHIRPLFINDLKCYSFYSEQRYQHDIWNPYRQSINKLSEEKGIFIMNNYKLMSKERFTGGALDISILDQISTCISHKKSGCAMLFRETLPGRFTGNIEPGKQCYVKVGTKNTYVKSEVIIDNSTLISEDSGYEKKTNKKVWGSKFGPLVFTKISNFDDFIDRNWK